LSRSRTLTNELARRLLARDRGAVPEALNLADDTRLDRRTAALALLETLEREAPFPGATRVGLTGAPGAGKSSLLDALVRAIRPSGQTVAIIAVDPSSRNTGGALLGDRVRVRSGASDPGVYIRSMAAREQLGGLAESAGAAVLILATAFDWVFVETVGVGQSESEVASLVDTLVYVASPGSGDTLQYMKAGVLEFPDIFAVNKADLGPAAGRTAAELGGGVSLTEGRAGANPVVVLISARTGEGIETLVEALETHRDAQLRAGELRARRRSGRESQLIDAIERRYGSFGVERLGGRAGVEKRIRDAGEASAFSLLAALSRDVERVMREEQPTS
jgi:LAO/AO transport system kinase